MSYEEKKWAGAYTIEGDPTLWDAPEAVLGEPDVVCCKGYEDGLGNNLVVSNFGFALPDNAINISVYFGMHAEGYYGQQQVALRLIDPNGTADETWATGCVTGGLFCGCANANQRVVEGKSWYTGWKPSDLNNENFKLFLYCGGVLGTGALAGVIDAVYMRVTYDLAVVVTKKEVGEGIVFYT